MRRAPLALAALVISAFTLTAAACQPSTDGILVGDVQRATVTEIVDVPASVTARAVATLTAPADGTLAKLAVEPGATVAKGAVVAVIDSPSARKRLADAKAALSASRAFGGGGSVNLGGLQQSIDAAAKEAFSTARDAAGQVADEKVRAALLAHINAASKQYATASATSKKLLRQVQQGLAGIGQAVAALGAAQRIQAQSAYDLAKSTVDALTLRAPMAGVVQFARPASASGSGDALSTLLGAVGGSAGAAGAAAAVPSGATDQTVAGVDDILSVGDRVGAGTPIVTIVDVSEIGLVGEVDETDVLLVTKGVAANVELDAAPGTQYQAVVRTVDLLPTPSARGGVAYRVRLTFDAAKDDLATPRPGMSAVAHLRVRAATDAVAVPASAVFTSDTGEAVWVINAGEAVLQPVTLGLQGEELVQIVKGLNPGQRIVVSGTDKVTAGLELS